MMFNFNIWTVIAMFWATMYVAAPHDPHPGSFDRKGTDCSVFEGDLWYMCQKMNALSSHVSELDSDHPFER